MTQFEKADLNKDGKIDEVEWQKLALEDRWREMNDNDAKRDSLCCWYVVVPLWYRSGLCAWLR